MFSRKWLCRGLFPIVLAFSVSSTAYALDPAPDFQSSGFQVEAYGGIADMTTNFGPEYTTPVNPFNPNPNILGGSTDSAQFAPGLGASYAFPTQSLTAIGKSYILHDVSLGVNAYYLGAQRTGPIYLNGTPGAVNNNYTMNVNSWRVMLDGEFDFHPVLSGWIMPFFEAGIGDAINEMDYSETPTALGLYSVDAESQVTNNLAYELGGGIKVPLSERSNFSFRYLYSDLGEAEVSNTTASSTLGLGQPLVTDVHASSFLLGFNYGFG